VVGIGNQQEVPIPDGKDMFGRDVYHTYQGERVLTRLHEVELQALATAIGGEYFRADQANDLERLDRVMSQVESSRLLTIGRSGRKENQYQWFLGVAFLAMLVVLLSELGIGLRRRTHVT